MKELIQVPVKERVVMFASDIVYGQRVEWCGVTYRQLCLSLMRPRSFYTYDDREKHPCIVWFCGGAFSEQNRNVWSPEMAYYCKHGYAVACVDYTVNQRMRYPELLIDVKEAIRYLRAHADELFIDAEHIAVMGESAGGFLSALVGLTNGCKEFERFSNLGYSSDVQAVVPFYTPGGMKRMDAQPDSDNDTNPDTQTTCTAVVVNSLPNLIDMVRPGCPPFMLLHGTGDLLVPYAQGVALYDALEAAGNEADMLLIDGANHADQQFVQTEVKDRVIAFLDKHLKA